MKHAGEQRLEIAREQLPESSRGEKGHSPQPTLNNQ